MDKQKNLVFMYECQKLKPTAWGTTKLVEQGSQIHFRTLRHNEDMTMDTQGKIWIHSSRKCLMFSKKI